MPLRKIRTHMGNPVNDTLMITVNDEPDPKTKAHHQYNIESPDGRVALTLHFQNGPIPEAGVNGVTHEVLIAIVMDRLESYQRGPFACEENAAAITHLKAAQESLLNRSKDREKRGVEGTRKP